MNLRRHNITLAPGALMDRQRGFSLVELMVSIAIGLVIMAGLVAMFLNSSNNQRELQRASARIENGRFAMDTLTQDIHHAGYYGMFFQINTPATAADPCAISTFADIQTAAGFPVQAYPAASSTARPVLSATSCGSILTNANLAPGSDIVVIRRADTNVLAVGSVAAVREVYIQSNPYQSALQEGSGATMTTSTSADGGAATIKNAAGTAAAEIRKFRVHIYFVAPCSRPNGGGTTCTGSSDDGGDPIPTLKRLELVSVGGARTFSVIPIAEGVEYLQLSYGIDNDPTTVNSQTNFKGDGIPDEFKQAPTLADLSNIVSSRVSMLVRNADKSQSFSDNKTYQIGSMSLGPFNDKFRRHVFDSEIRMVNLAARREIPR
ncbi:MAG TPA: PilW family protein [Usitatibacteraceae bacterium]|nr:PilW family protein [Usitatibacteraceae bacterium]